MKEFSCKTRLYSGPGAMEALREAKSRRLLLVADPYFSKNGVANKLLALSGAAETALFDRVAPDPDLNLVAEATAAVRAFEPDTVAALGGGSAMDLAKAAAWFSGLSPRTVMLPTTAGSGSEVTDFAVLTRGQTKYPLTDPALRPDMAILDSRLVTGLPKGLIAQGGFDLLCHALEALVATEACPITDALAKEAFVLGLTLLPKSYAGDTAAAGAVQQAATLAGLAFTHSGLGLCHGIAHSLGAAFHIPHGCLVAMALPGVVTCNSAVAAAKYAALARAAGLSGSADAVAVRSLRNALVGLQKSLDLPTTLSRAGVSRQAFLKALPQLVEQVVSDPCCSANPVAVTPELARAQLMALA